MTLDHLCRSLALDSPRTWSPISQANVPDTLSVALRLDACERDILIHLWTRPTRLTQTALVVAVDCSESTVKRAIKRLKLKSLIQPHHKAPQGYTLTDDGKAVVGLLARAVLAS